MTTTTELLVCGHAPMPGHPVTVAGKTIQGWTFRLDDHGQKVCTACYVERTVLDCGHHPTLAPDDYLGTGYGTDHEGKRHCYACCAVTDRQQMIETGKSYLYLSGRTVQNWPGSLKFPASHVRETRHMAFGRSVRARVGYFIGPDGKPWSIHVRGDMDCGVARRLKH